MNVRSYSNEISCVFNFRKRYICMRKNTLAMTSEKKKKLQLRNEHFGFQNNSIFMKLPSEIIIFGPFNRAVFPSAHFRTWVT